MKALIFIVDTVFSLAVYVFLLRFLLQLVRADFRNPIAQAVLQLTNWLVRPLRRVLPPLGQLDTASLVATALVQLLATAITFWLLTGVWSPASPLLIGALRQLAIAAIQLYTFILVGYALLSFVAPGAPSPAVHLLGSLAEPLLRPVRRLLPAMAGLDLSPLVVIIGLQALRLLIS
ncbi:MAG: YggT family protein [Gammaproteobacteria bacterium]|nr:MAG: YggT family protein [Gammaproteobacteria bacterium]